MNTPSQQDHPAPWGVARTSSGWKKHITDRNGRIVIAGLDEKLAVRIVKAVNAAEAQRIDAESKSGKE